MIWRQGPPFAWVIVLVFLVWVLYFIYKVASHVGAWPFG